MTDHPKSAEPVCECCGASMGSEYEHFDYVSGTGFLCKPADQPTLQSADTKGSDQPTVERNEERLPDRIRQSSEGKQTEVKAEPLRVYCNHNHRVTGAEMYIADLTAQLAEERAKRERLEEALRIARDGLEQIEADGTIMCEDQRTARDTLTRIDAITEEG